MVSNASALGRNGVRKLHPGWRYRYGDAVRHLYGRFFATSGELTYEVWIGFLRLLRSPKCSPCWRCISKSIAWIGISAGVDRLR